MASPAPRRSLNKIVVPATSAVVLLAMVSWRAVDASVSDDVATSVVETATVSDVALFNSAVVHDIKVDFDQAAYDEMIDIFSTDRTKEWIEATQLDVDAFATYLAFQDLIGNADDINGAGNNAYLHNDYDSKRFTVVNWDLNLAFNTTNVAGGGPGLGGGRGGFDGERPERPEGAPERGAGGLGGGPGNQPNVLVDRFMADETFAELYNTKTVELTELLYTSGTVDDVVATWSGVVNAGAGDLVRADTVAAEAAAIADYVATAL